MSLSVTAGTALASAGKVDESHQLCGREDCIKVQMRVPAPRIFSRTSRFYLDWGSVVKAESRLATAPHQILPAAVLGGLRRHLLGEVPVI